MKSKSKFEVMRANQERMKESCERFHEIFGFELHAVFSLVGGLDTSKLDVFLGTPEGIATSAWITSQYGEDACECVRTLL